MNPLKPLHRRAQAAVALLLFLAVAAEPALAEWAPQQAATDSQVTAAPQKLQIVILEGEDTLNNIHERTAREPIVEVQDENHKPVAGALVLFSVHGGASGAGGTIAGAASSSVVTGANGQAVLQGLVVNQTAGNFTIDVQASYQNLTAKATIHEANVNGSSSETQQNQPSASQEVPAVHPPAAESVAVAVRKHITKREWLVVSASAAALATVIVFTVRRPATNISVGAGVVHP